MFKKVRSLDQMIRYHLDAKRRECPECFGKAKLPDGRWCKACGMTGIVGGSLPTEDQWSKR